MSVKAEEVFHAGLALEATERAAVAQRLLASVPDSPPADPDIDVAWRAEFHRRIREIDNGDVELVSSDDSQARVEALLATLHE